MEKWKFILHIIKNLFKKSKESEKQDEMENAGSSTRKTSMLHEKL